MHQFSIHAQNLLGAENTRSSVTPPIAPTALTYVGTFSQNTRTLLFTSTITLATFAPLSAVFAAAAALIAA